MNDMMDFSDLAKQMDAQDNRPVEQKIHDAITKNEALVIHPVADIFPRIKDCDSELFNTFVEDIKLQGVNEPIKINTVGAVVDGRNRIDAIRRAIEGGTTPTFNVEILNRTPAKMQEWILSTNLHRRHLNESQRAMIADDLATATKSDGGKRSQGTEAAPVVTLKEAAVKMKVSKSGVEKARQVKNKAAEQNKPEIVKAVKDGNKSVSAALKELKPKPVPKPVVKPTVKMNGVEVVASQPTVPVPNPATKCDAPLKPPVASTKVDKPSVEQKKADAPALALSKEELTQVKKLISGASSAQLAGLLSHIKTTIKVAGI